MLSGILFAQKNKKTDNLPGYSGFSADLSKGFVVNVVDNGIFGDKDFVVENFNTFSGESISSFVLGTSGREGFAHALINSNNVFVTGQSNLNTGSFDDIFISRLDIDNISNSWVKIFSGNLSDKGKRIFSDDSNLILLAISNSSTTKLSLILSVIDFNGTITKSKLYDFNSDFYPTGFSSDISSYYISGYSFNGAVINGRILKLNKANLSVEWDVLAENSNGIEINQLLVNGDDVYFSGWSGNGTNNALIYGSFDLNGKSKWYRVVAHDGLATLTDMKIKDNELVLSGFLRMQNGDEEDQMLVIVDTLSKESSIYTIPDQDRTYSSSLVLQKSDSIFTSSYNTSSSLDFGNLQYWEETSNGCYEELITAGFEDHSSLLSFSSSTISESTNPLNEVAGGVISSVSDTFFEFQSCERAEHIVGVDLNQFDCNLTLNVDEGLLENDCQHSLKKIEVVNNHGQLISSSNEDDFNFTDLEKNQIYFIRTFWLDEKGELYIRVLKYFH